MKRSGFANEGRAMGPWSILRLFFCLRQLSLGHRDPGNSEVNGKIDRCSLTGFGGGLSVKKHLLDLERQSLVG